MKPIIAAEKLGKKYKRYTNRRGRLLEWLSGGRLQRHEERWVLRDISFAVPTGGAVGVIGVNGAGKSTLLKILTGATRPSEGRVRLHGRVAALLELGMGFNPEFSGRQNAITACQLMGFSNRQITELLPEIEAFAELGDYLDQPLRTYSSGMQMRLAFSAAVVRRPETLIIDEALSVGDAYFQHKSLARIRQFKEQGSTLFFVSHDPGAVKSICDRALLLDQGRLLMDGTPEQVYDYYHAMIARREKDEEIRQATGGGGVSTRSGNRRAEIRQVEMYSAAGEVCRAFQSGERALIRCRIERRQQASEATVGFLLRDRLGNDIFGTNTSLLGQPLPEAAGELEVEFELALNLGRGHYSLTAAVHKGDSHLNESYDWWDRVLVFEVIAGAGADFAGVAALPATVRVGAATEGED